MFRRSVFTIVLFLAFALSACSTQSQTGTPLSLAAHPTKINHSGTTPTPLPTTTPASKPAPTTTSVSKAASHHTPVLGSSLSAFVAKYGQPNNHTQPSGISGYGLYHFQQYQGSHIDFLILMGTPQQIIDITLSAPDAPGKSWSSSQAETICSAFFPHDAVYQHQAEISTPPGSYDKIYFSQSLAGILHPSDFTDANRHPAKPGMFDAMYTTTPDKTVSKCNILPGTSQTQ